MEVIKTILWNNCEDESFMSFFEISFFGRVCSLGLAEGVCSLLIINNVDFEKFPHGAMD